MPEYTPVLEVTLNLEKLRSLLEDGPRATSTLAAELKLTKSEVLGLLQRLEENNEVFCRLRYWHLVDKCCLCEEPVYRMFNRHPYCAEHYPYNDN